MKFQMVHQNFNVSDLEKSMAFYEAAFGLKEVSRITQRMAHSRSSMWATRPQISYWNSPA